MEPEFEALRGMLLYFAVASSWAKVTPPCAWISAMPRVPSEPEPERTTPIARLTGEYEVIVVPADSKFQSLNDLVAAMKADPGSVAWAGGSAGGTDHILVGLIAQAAGADSTKINYVPFSGGGEALAAISVDGTAGAPLRRQLLELPDVLTATIVNFGS